MTRKSNTRRNKTMGQQKTQCLLDEPKKQNPKMLNELIESLTVKQTPDSTTVEEGVESITEKV